MNLAFTYEDCFRHLVAETVGVAELEQRARAGERLRVKLGIDPTSTNIHVGRTLPLWRLRAFQELGHEIHLIIGDFTAQVGDTSDKESERPMLTAEQVEHNLQDYEKQLWMVLNPERKDQVIFHRNSEWLAPLTFSRISQLADAFSVNQFMKRELIARRLDRGDRVSLREMLYPVMQGYDSIAIEADVEVGGSDQWFNLLAGRTLQETAGQRPQAVITNILLNGTDGKKMSSSQGNVITLNQPAPGFFTQVMQVRDEVMPDYIGLFPLSAQPFTQEQLTTRLAAGENPRNLKLELAEQLTALYFGEEKAAEARQRWEHEATGEHLRADIPTFQLKEASYPLFLLIVSTGLAATNSDARRLVTQRGVRLGGELCTDAEQVWSREQLQNKDLQAGKHRFVHLEA